MITECETITANTDNKDIRKYVRVEVKEITEQLCKTNNKKDKHKNKEHIKRK